MSKSSSSSSEKVTIAYTESLVSDEEESSEGFSSASTVSSSLETPTSQQSESTVLDALDTLRETEKYFGYVPVTTDPGPKMNALQYFQDHSIFQLYTFMMTHLLAHSPEDPVEFLVSLVERCINYREGKYDQPPLVFEDNHIASVYTALDLLGDGSITYRQYVNGMTTLGLTEFNVMPNEIGSRQRDVAKEVFLLEAKRALVTRLDRWLGSTLTKTTMTSEDISHSNDDENRHTHSVTGQFDVKEDGFAVYDKDSTVNKKKQGSITSAGSGTETASFQLTPEAYNPDKPISFIKTPQPSENKSSAYIFSNPFSNVSLKP